MRGSDTSLGGSRRNFPETTWGLISRVRNPANPEHRAGLEQLCRTYWKPVYRYVRIAWAKSNEDAKDLTQAFFAWLLEGDALKRYAPVRGGFRPYLKVLLRRFVRRQEEALRAMKRGGGTRLVPLDDGALAGVLPDPKGAKPEELFDAAWVSEVVEQATERVKKHLSSSGRASDFRVYEQYELCAAPERPTYAQLASRLGITESDVRHRLEDVRAELRAEIRAALTQVTSNETELEDEWTSLFQSAPPEA